MRREPEREIVGVGRLSKVYGGDEAEFAILIKDDYQGKGLGRELLQRLLEVARDEPDQAGLAGASPDAGAKRSAVASARP